MSHSTTERLSSQNNRSHVGSDLFEIFSTDSAALIVNETAVKYMGIEHTVGETITWGRRDYIIVGVVKDMLMESPFKSVKPTIYFINRYDDGANYMLLRLNPDQSASVSLATIKGVFSQYIPDVPFEYTFTDVEHARKFAAVEHIGKLAGIFAILAIITSCLGLFGLSSFMAEKRTKEIGIRKVLGATVFSIWQLLSKEFVVLVILACAIFIPIAYYSLTVWLQNYEYRMDLHWWFFGFAIAGALMITLVTVSFQAIKSVMMNPVKSLRDEYMGRINRLTRWKMKSFNNYNSGNPLILKIQILTIRINHEVFLRPQLKSTSISTNFIDIIQKFLIEGMGANSATISDDHEFLFCAGDCYIHSAGIS